MKINIKLLQASGRLDTKEPFFIADNAEFFLNITSATKFDKVLLALNNEKATATLVYEDKAVTVPKAVLKAGILRIRASIVQKGEVIKEMDIEPITLKEVHQGFEGYSAFDELCEKQKETAEKINKILAIIDENQARTNMAIESLAELIDKQSVL